MNECCRTVWAGKVPIGSEHPIACQTMGTTDTRDVMATVEQVRLCGGMSRSVDFLILSRW